MGVVVEGVCLLIVLVGLFTVVQTNVARNAALGSIIPQYITLFDIFRPGPIF